MLKDHGLSRPALPAKALFLDRDGVINIDYGYVYKIEDCRFVPGIFDLCARARELGYKIIVVTNQSGVARGYFGEDDFLKFMDYVRGVFQARGCPIDDVFYCPYHKDGLPPWNIDSPDRKPAPGMILKAARKHNIDLRASALIGDSESDVQAGKSAGVGRNILLSGPITTEFIKNALG